MLSVSYCKDDNCLHIKIGGDNFRELVDFCKEQGAHYNEENRDWVAPIVKYYKIIENAKALDEIIDIDGYTEQKVEEFYKSLKELKYATSRRTFHQELLKSPPLKGKAPYENFQLQDILRAMNQNRFLFHHEMGLGKSYSLTALIEHLIYYRCINKCLIFSTAVGVMNLKAEILKFSVSLTDKDIITFASAGELKFEDRDIFNTEKYPQTVIIITYDTLKSISNYYYDVANATKKNKHPSTGKKYRKNFMPIKEWIGAMPAGLFLDENHSLAHPDTRRTQIINRIIPEFEYRYLFTGTLADTYEKLYEPLWILDKSLVKGDDYDGWLDEYNERGNYWSPKAINPDRWNLPKIGELNKTLMQSYASKRKMADCMNLPLNFEVPTLYTDMSKKQRAIYEAFSNFTMTDMQEMAKKEGKTLTEKVKNLFPYIQMCVDNPECLKRTGKFDVFPDNLRELILSYDYNKDCTKAEVCDNIIADNVDELDHKGILWYMHPETAKALYERYKKYNPVVINAELPREQRVDIINKFLKDPKQKLIIASINIMNTSVTLIECKFEVYVEKTYNFTVYKQSRGRITRPGQDEVTRTYSIRYDKSIDNLQEMNLSTKGETLNSLLNKDYITHDLWAKLFNLQRGDRI